MAWSPSDAQLAHDIILRRTGIAVPVSRAAQLTAALDAALKLVPNKTALLDALDKQPMTSAAVRAVVERLTINETHFFRNRPQFDYLRRSLLPAVIEERAASRTLRVWSAACSSGEEPYSIAILLDHLLAGQQWNLHVVGSDIDQQVLAKAREGLYGDWSFREVPAEFRDKYFAQAGDRIALDPRIRAMAQFEQLNLADRSWPSRRPSVANMDLILCRNVLIYFREEQVQRIADQLFDALRPGGWLLVGHAEPNQMIFKRFVAHHVPGTVLYQRPPLAAPRPAPPRPQITVKRPPPPMSLTDLHRLAARDPGSAIRQLEQETNPTVERQLLLCRLLAGRNRLAEARQTAEKVIARQMLNAEAYYLLGIIARETRDTATAVSSLRRAGFLEREFALARVALAGALADQGQTRRAQGELQSAAELLEGKPATAAVMGDPDLNVGRLREQIAGQLTLLKRPSNCFSAP